MRFLATGALLLAAFVTLAACGVGGDSGGRTPSAGSNAYSGPLVTSVPRPASVPESASALDATLDLGTITRRPNAQPATGDTRTLDDASCQDGVIVLETSDETVYAARGCDGFWTDAEAPVFVQQEMAIVLERTDRYTIAIETLEGAQARFTVEGIWLE